MQNGERIVGILVALILTVALTVGCHDGYGEPHAVVIIDIRDDPNCSSNVATVVEFPDQSRWDRCGEWGEPGDTIRAYKRRDRVSGYPYGWRSP